MKFRLPRREPVHTAEKPLRVLVCGDRHWTNTDAIRREFSKLPAGSLIIHGDNGYDAYGKALWGEPDRFAIRGADKLAGAVAEEFGFIVERYTPDWVKYEKAAGPIRNTQMLKEGKPDLVLAFHERISQSKGTANMIRQVEKAGIEVRLFSE